MKSNLSLPVEFSINQEYVGKDSRFISVTIDVLNTGLNYNNSIFEKDIVDANIETIKNTPILGFIQEVDDMPDFKGHEYKVTKTIDGEKRTYVGTAYGLIPESCNPRWIEKQCNDGNTYTTLQVDGLLWTKFEKSSEIMLRDIEKGHSMELSPDSVDGYEDENGVFHFTSFSFDGCCILGDTAQPAMEGSKIEVNFSVSDFVKQIQTELKNNYLKFTKLVDENNQGGSETMSTEFSQTVLQQFEDVSSIVKSYESLTDRWGDSVPRFSLVDIQDNEVICVDRANDYQYCGFTFTVSGDKPQIDFASCNRKKIRYEKYEDSDSMPNGAFDFGEHISNIEESAFEKIESFQKKIDDLTSEKQTIETEFSTLNAEYDDIKAKYEAYVEKEKADIALAESEKKNEIFTRFESVIGDIPEFNELKENKDNYSVEDITNKCSVIYTNKTFVSTNTSFEKNDNAGHLAVGVCDNTVDDGEDGYVSTSKYGNIKKS